MSILLFIWIGKAWSVGYDTVGTIWPIEESGVLPSINNKNEYADYVFTFKTDTSVPAASTLTVKFPEQFDSGLGIAGSPTCVGGTCVLSERTVVLTLTSAITLNTNTSITIQAIKNPNFVGGTGNFELWTTTGPNLLDQNLIYGVIGIADEVSLLASTSVTLESGGNPNAGEITKYDWTFKTETILPASSWIRFTFPTSAFYLATYPTCTAFSINGKFLAGTLSCVTSGDQVTMTGNSEEVAAGTEIGIKISCTNPTHTGTTGSFSIETGRTGTNTLYDRRISIPGVVIQSGVISGITMTAVESTTTLSKGKWVLYRLIINMTNPIEQGGTIEIECNNDFNMDLSDWGQQIEHGLDDQSASVEASMAYSLKKLTISNFAAYSPSEISLLLEFKNPTVAGDTTPLKITSKKADGTIIDYNDQDAKVTIDSATSAPTITHAFQGNDYADGNTILIRFTLVPGIQIDELGFIEVKVPVGFTAGTTSSCDTQPKTIATQSAAACTQSGGVISLQLANTPNSGTFTAGLDHWIQVGGGLIAPTAAGKYIFEFTTKSPAEAVLETQNHVVTINPEPFATFSFLPVHFTQAADTILEVSFTTIHAIPSGAAPSLSTDEQGFIEVRLVTNDGTGGGWPLSLFTGIAIGSSVPCKGITNVLPVVTGGDLTCVVSELGLIGQDIVILVSEFQAINQNTPCELHIANIKNPATGYQANVQVDTYRKLNRVKYELNTGLQNSANTMAASTATATTETAAFTSTDTTVNTATTLSHASILIATGAANPAKMLVRWTTSHDSGYCGVPDNVACQVAGASATCNCYKTAEMILITTTGVSSPNVSLDLQQITNPASVNTTPDVLEIQIINSSRTVTEIITFTASPLLPLQTAATFQSVVMTPSEKGYEYRDISHVWQIKTTNLIPLGGKIILTWPSGHFPDLNVSTPAPVCSTAGLTEATTAGISCILFTNTAEITNFLALTQAQTDITITVSGIRNPASTVGISTGDFRATTRNAASEDIDDELFAGFDYSAVFASSSINFVSVESWPSNAKATAEYVISFTPNTAIPAGGFVEFTFPSVQFGTLPNPPECRVTGSLFTFASCTSAQTKVTLETDTVFTSGKLTFSLFGIPNFDEGNSNDFTIKTTYDGMTLDQTLTVGSTLQQATVTAQGLALTVTNIDFWPRNEGEIANYEFHFKPNQDIPATRSLQIVFPSTYDNRLGENIDCWSSQGLGGFIKCTVDHRRLTVTGHDYYSTCESCTIIFNVYGVVNPTKISSSNTGHFEIGLIENRDYLESNLQAGELDMITAPLYNNILVTTSENQNSRYENNFSFNITTTSNIPKNDFFGAIWVEFPSDYVIESSSIHCRTSSFWADGTPDCLQDHDRMKLTGQTADFVGNMMVYLDEVPNPLTEVTAKSIIVETYDGFNKAIVDRSYTNLNPNRFTFTYPGPLIKINDDQPVVVERGTMSDFVPVTLDYPCALNLTLVPSSTGFTFVPFNIELGVGEIYEDFRISVPASTDDNEYIINWTILGERNPLFYTPISKTLFEVTKNQNIAVSVESIMDVPRNGTSLPHQVILERAPDVDLTVHLSIPAATSNGITLDPSKLEFQAGDIYGTFQILVQSFVTASTSQVDLSLSGTNTDPYVLAASSAPFNIISESTSTPNILTISTSATTRTTATVNFSTDRVCRIYYAYALLGTDPPTFAQVRDQGPTEYSTTRTIYGAANVDSSLSGSISLTGLTAQTKYTFYGWVESLNGYVSEEIKTTDFTTSLRYNAAEFQLTFEQTYINEVEADLAMEAVGVLLSLNNWRILEKSTALESQTEPTDTTSESGARRRAQQISSVLDLNILDDPGTDVYPTPKALVDLLNSQRSTLDTMINNFDETEAISGAEIHVNPCDWDQDPTLSGSASHEQISFTASLKEEGYVFAIAIRADNDTNTPYSYEIQEGLDGRNRPAKYLSHNVQPNILANQTFTELDADTHYNVYVTCGNMYPGFADLLADDQVVLLQWKTDLTPAPTPINTDMANLLTIALIATVISFF